MMCVTRKLHLCVDQAVGESTSSFILARVMKDGSTAHVASGQYDRETAALIKTIVSNRNVFDKKENSNIKLLNIMATQRTEGKTKYAISDRLPFRSSLTKEEFGLLDKSILNMQAELLGKVCSTNIDSEAISRGSCKLAKNMILERRKMLK